MRHGLRTGAGTAANVVMLTGDHAAQAAEIALDPVRVLAVVAVGLGVVDAFGFPTGMQHVPMAGFVGMHDGHAVNVLLCKFNALCF